MFNLIHKLREYIYIRYFWGFTREIHQPSQLFEYMPAKPEYARARLYIRKSFTFRWDTLKENANFAGFRWYLAVAVIITNFCSKFNWICIRMENKENHNVSLVRIIEQHFHLRKNERCWKRYTTQNLSMHTASVCNSLNSLDSFSMKN